MEQLRTFVTVYVMNTRSSGPVLALKSRFRDLVPIGINVQIWSRKRPDLPLKSQSLVLLWTFSRREMGVSCFLIIISSACINVLLRTWGPDWFLTQHTQCDQVTRMNPSAPEYPGIWRNLPVFFQKICPDLYKNEPRWRIGHTAHRNNKTVISEHFHILAILHQTLNPFLMEKDWNLSLKYCVNAVGRDFSRLYRLECR